MREMLQWWGHQSWHACLSDMSSDGDKSPAASPPRTRQPSPSPCGWSSGSDGGPPPPPPPRPPHRPPRRRAAQVAGQDLQLPGATHGPRGAGLPHPGVLPCLPLPGPLHLLDDRGVRGGGGGAALPAGDRDRALVQPGADREELVRGLPVPLPGILMLLLSSSLGFTFLYRRPWLRLHLFYIYFKSLVLFDYWGQLLGASGIFGHLCPFMCKFCEFHPSFAVIT